jgi:hypothetical protein
MSVDSVPFNQTSVQRIEITSSENKHDMAIVEIVGVSSTYVLAYIDKAVVINIGILGNKNTTFYGYVSHIDGTSVSHEGTTNNSPFQILRMVCFGTSHKLRGKTNRIWENVSLKDIVSTIASKNRFAYSIPTDKYRFSRLAQVETSDWKFIVQTCQSIGYSVLASNSHIHIWDKAKAIGRQMSYTTLKGGQALKIDYRPFPGAIIEFSPVLGKISPTGSSNTTQVSYADERGILVNVSNSDINGNAFLGSDIPPFASDSLAMNVQTFDAVERALKSARSFSPPYSCNALLYGEPSIAAGGIVNVEGYGSNFDGFWYVNSVTQQLSTDRLLTSVSLEKDGDNDALPPFPKVQRYQIAPEPVLLNQRWVVRNEFANVYN